MNKSCLTAMALVLSASLLAGCGAATQNIPVSTNPTGAMVYADGVETCSAPCTVTLEKTQPHILTFKLDGYKQADVQISRKYDTGGVTRDAMQTGMRQKSFGASTEAAVANALLSTESSESNGDAYVLTPSSVVVKLVADGQKANSGIAAPQKDKPAEVQKTNPATIEKAVKENPLKEAEDVLEGAAVAAPTIHSEKEVGHSKHTSTHMNSDGSMESHSSSSSTSVGVSVNPVEAGLDVLHLLEGAEDKKAE